MRESILRSARCTFNLYLVLLLLVTLDSKRSIVDSCGVTIHNEVAFRASRILLAQPDHPTFSSCPCPQAHLGLYSASCPHLQSTIRPHWAKEKTVKSQQKALDDFVPLLAHKELLFAGSFFPDWGYNCIGKIWNNVAEEAHWPPFIEESIKYILETYPRPWTDHAKDLITFLFGVVSHSIGDLSWHALRGLDAGFISALAGTSFDGDFSKGHTLADVGAEFVLSHMSKMNHLITRWKVPVRDITEIYKRMGHRVPGPILSHCMRSGYAAAQANAILGSQLFPVYASKSPFLIEQVISYPMGGLKDMAEWTVDCWNGFAEYLNQVRQLPDDEDRKANGTVNLCYALWEDRTKHDPESATKLAHERQIRHEHGDGSPSGSTSAFQRLTLAGVQVKSKVNDDTGMVTFFTEEAERAKGGKVEETEEVASRQSSLSSLKDHFGNSLGSKAQNRFTRRNYASELTSRSQNTRAQSSKVGSNICLAFKDEVEDQTQTRTLFLPMEHASFGHAVVTGDFDGDGNTDIAMAAPHLTLDPMVPSQGAVFIVSSQALFTTQHGETGTDVRSIASRVLYGDPDEPQSRFGWSLAVVDLNQDGIDDLAIGAPGRGAKELKYDGSIFVFFGHKGAGLSQEPDLVIYHDRAKDGKLGRSADVGTLAGLGYRLEGQDLTGSGFKDLLVGMPMATTRAVNTNDGSHATRKAQAGKILAFLSRTLHSGRKLDSDHDWQLEGKDAFGWFGASFTVISQGFYESASKWSLLSSLFSWLDLSRRDHQSIQQKFVKQRILVVGSPSFGRGEQDAMSGKIQGFVIPDFPQKPLSGSDKPLSLPTPRKIFTIHGDNKFGQLGSRIVPNQIRPSSARHLTSQFPLGVPVELLVIGSQSENILNHLPKLGRQWQAGVVRVLDISILPEGADVKISDLDAMPDVVRDSLHGSQSMAHLSAAMEVSTDGRSLWLTEPYAKQEAGRILEWEPNFDRQRDDERQRGRNGRREMQRKGILGGAQRRQVISGDGNDDGDDDDDTHFGVKQCFFGEDYRGRFGSQLLIEDLNKDGRDDIVVTSSHASRYATMAGIVTVKFRL